MIAIQSILILVAAVFTWVALKVVGIGYGMAEFEFDEVYRQRRPLNDQDMYDLYMAESGVDARIVSRIRRIFGYQLQLDAERLLPDDDFSRIYDDLDFAELVYEVEEAFDIDLSDVCPLFGTVRVTSEIVQYKLLERFGRVVLPPDDSFPAALRSGLAYN